MANSEPYRSYETDVDLPFEIRVPKSKKKPQIKIPKFIVSMFPFLKWGWKQKDKLNFNINLKGNKNNKSSNQDDPIIDPLVDDIIKNSGKKKRNDTISLRDVINNYIFENPDDEK